MIQFKTTETGVSSTKNIRLDSEIISIASKRTTAPSTASITQGIKWISWLSHRHRASWGLSEMKMNIKMMREKSRSPPCLHFKNWNHCLKINSELLTQPGMLIIRQSHSQVHLSCLAFPPDLMNMASENRSASKKKKWSFQLHQVTNSRQKLFKKSRSRNCCKFLTELTSSESITRKCRRQWTSSCLQIRKQKTSEGPLKRGVLLSLHGFIKGDKISRNWEIKTQKAEKKPRQTFIRENKTYFSKISKIKNCSKRILSSTSASDLIAQTSTSTDSKKQLTSTCFESWQEPKTVSVSGIS